MTRCGRLIALAAIAAVPVGCGDDPDPVSDSAPAGRATVTEPAASAAEPGAATRGPLVKLRDSQFGPVIFNGRDQAAYTFTRDRGRSRCYGDCARAWPPFFARGKPRAGPGIKRELLGTVRRRGGRRQVTYGGRPLYFYEHDPKGEVLCNDIVEFGGTWFAVTAAGKPPA
jgi:predicted lipoprotein with Yx(FWY)xxD motif